MPGKAEKNKGVFMSRFFTDGFHKKFMLRLCLVKKISIAAKFGVF